MSKKDSRIEGTVIFRKKSAILVEFMDEGIVHRITCPADSLEVLEGGKVLLSSFDIEQGILYGIPWEFKLHEVVITPEKMASELRKNGIWTSEDARKNPEGVKGSVLAMVSSILYSVNQLVKESRSMEEN
jgi:hypothetical protein